MSLSVHGVFLDIFNTGVLLTGNSGIGKSELALALINVRKHRLIADDCVEFNKQDKTLIGSCPPLLQNFLEIRGLGVVNIRSLFGEQAISQAKPLELVIKLARLETLDIDATGRLFGLNTRFSLFGIEVPEITLPVTAGQNLSTLVEVAVRNQQLKNQGYDAAQDFAEQQRSAVKNDTNQSQ